MSNVPPESQTAYYPIRVVSSETGVNAITLRAWERRYGLITPKRTAKGHRLYTADDIKTIRQVVALLNRGIPVSQAQAMIENGETPEIRSKTTSSAPSQWQHYRSSLATAVHALDALAVTALFTEVAQFFPLPLATRYLYLPQYQQLKESRQLAGGTARLRFFTSVLQAKLASQLYDEYPTEGPEVLLANSSHDDDPDLLLLALLLRQHGLRPLWLNGQTTPQQLSEITTEPRWQAIVIQVSANAESQLLASIGALSNECGHPVFIGGLTESEQPDLLQRGLIWLQSDLHQASLTIRDMLTGLTT